MEHVMSGSTWCNNENGFNTATEQSNSANTQTATTRLGTYVLWCAGRVIGQFALGTPIKSARGHTQMTYSTQVATITIPVFTQFRNFRQVNTRQMQTTLAVVATHSVTAFVFYGSQTKRTLLSPQNERPHIILHSDVVVWVSRQCCV